MHDRATPTLSHVVIVAAFAIGCGPETGESMGSVTESTSDTTESTSDTTEPTDSSETTTGEGVSVTLLAGGYYYGECGGPCRGQMSLQNNTLEHVVFGWEDETFGTWTGLLTSDGAAELATIEQLLATIEIEEMYGCPDGADGGGGFLLLDIDGVILRTDYPLDGACEEAPAEILAADAFLSPMMDGFTQCMASEAFTIDDPCIPFNP